MTTLFNHHDTPVTRLLSRHLVTEQITKKCIFPSAKGQAAADKIQNAQFRFWYQ